MALWDTYLVDGTDLANVATVVEVWDGAFLHGDRRGSNLVVPGVPGEIFAAKGRAVSTLTLGLVIMAVDPDSGAAPTDETTRVAMLNANLTTLRRLLAARTDIALTLTRRRSMWEDTEVVEQEHTALGELARPLAPTVVGAAQAARVVVELKILDGLWYEDPTTVTGLTDSITLDTGGDSEAPTTKVVVTFSEAGTLTNATLGCSLTASTALTVDAETMVPTAGTVSGQFALLPGDNLLDISAGSVDLAYRRAFL